LIFKVKIRELGAGFHHRGLVGSSTFNYFYGFLLNFLDLEN